MQVKIDILEGLQRKIIVEIPANQVDEKVSKGLRKAQKSAKIDGFRKGKVPINVVKQKYGSAVRQDVLGDLIEESYTNAIKQEKIIPAGQPKIKPVSGFAENEPFIFEATIEVVPEFDVKGIDSLSIKKPISEVADSDVKNMVNNLRKQSATWHSSDDASTEGNRVIVDFVGKIDGKAFDGGSAKDTPVILGAKQMLPEFEEALLNKKTGEKVTATVSFPEDYQGKEVAGKKADFEIEIKSVELEKLPEIDEDFVKRFGISDGNLSTLEKAIRENMNRELDVGIRRKINQQVMEQLVDSNKIMVPAVMIAQEKERMAHEQNLDKSIPDEDTRNDIIDKQFSEPARRRVLLGLIMSKLFEQEKIKPDAERVESHIESMAGTYDDPKKVREYYQKNPNAIEQVYAQIMEEQLIDSLLEKADIIEEKLSFDEVMQNKI